MRTRTLSILLLVALVATLFSAVSSSAAPVGASTEPTHAHVPGELLVGFSEGAGPQARARVHQKQRSTVIKTFEEIGVDLVRIPPGSTVAAAAASYRAKKEVEFASPNYLRRAYGITPNDPDFEDQWGLRNTGQTIVVNGQSDPGSSDADIDASEASLQDAWQVTTGTSAPIVGVIDTGIDISHPDLAANIWTNTGEIPGNNFDDDDNGYTDDVNGWDFFSDDNTVFDAGESCPGPGNDLNDDHGTHVAGIIGAVGNNSIGVTGVNWDVRIMPLKFLGKQGSTCGTGSDADAIEAILYATRMGAQFLNNSWGGVANDPALRQAFIAAGRGGVLAPVAAGNSGTDLASSPEYPASFGLENEVVVAASNNNDGLAGFSSFGGPTAFAAPGDNILSTITQPAGSYDFFSGTSMATPFVTGALALLRSQFPEAPSHELKDRLLDNVDIKAAFGGGKTTTGGRLNINKAIRDIGPEVIPTVLVPNGGEVLDAGATSNVEWKTNIPSGNPTLPYRVEYTTNANAATSSSSNFEGAMPAGISEPADSDAPWTISGTSSNGGSFSARSGAIANEEGSWMTLSRTFSTPGTVSFWYRVSSEDCTDGNTPVCGDYLRFYIDGYPVLEENGETGWQLSDSFEVEPGTHELSWAYQKDQLCPPAPECGGIPFGSDAAWIDDLSITGLDASSWNLAGATSAGATSLAWSVPSVETSTAKVRVCRDEAGSCAPGSSDESDDLFSIHVPVPGVTLSQSGGSTAVTEGGAADSYTVVLNTQPSSNVTISINAGSQLSTNSTSLVFTSSNWSTPQTVNVSAVNDSIDETSPHNGTITHAATSSDSAYNGISIPNINVAITDNDTAGVTVSQSGGSTNVTEGGASDSYTVVLTSQPTSNVTINISSGSQLSTNVSSLLFTSSNWSTPQTVNVSAVNDGASEGLHNGTITHSASSSDGSYNGISIASVNASITDNDSAGVAVTQSGGSTLVTEGGAGDSYTVALTTQPASNVTISINAGSQLSTNPTSLVFTSSNWSTPQTVNVSAVNDAASEGLHNGTITHSASSSDGSYNGISIASVNASITDNDSPGVAVTQSGGSTLVTEGGGGGDSYTVALTTQPASNVTISINAGSQLSTNPTSLVFTSSNWSTPQTVNVSAVNDSTLEGVHSANISHSASSSDGGYNGIGIPGVLVSITDNDAAAILISESGGSTGVVEGGATDSYTVVLQSAPSSDVTVFVNGGSQLSVSPLSMVFTAANWSSPRTVNIGAINDSSVEGSHSGTITHSASSSDSAYNGISIPSVTVSITDNDLSTWESLGGGLTPETGPAVSSWGNDRTDVFVKGNDAALWHRFWNGSVWSAWESLGGVLTSDPAAVSWGPGRIDVFVRGTDGQTWHMHFNGSSWSGWEALGGFITSAPAVSSWDPNRLDVFARGGDNGLWHMSWNATAWSGWESLGGGLASDPAAVSWSSNRIDVFVKGTDGQLWHMSWNGGSWSGWEALGGLLTSSPTTSSGNANRLDVFARGGDNRLWHRAWDGGSWTAWTSAGAPSTALGTFATSAPDATTPPGGQSSVFVRGPDGALWRRSWFPL